MARIKREMTADQVRSILGSPEKIRGLDAPTSENDPGSTETWWYGVDERSGAPTLGVVRFSAGKTNSEAADEIPPMAGILPEEETRRLLSLLYRARDDSSPLTVIKVYNALHRLGRQKALAIIDEFCRVNQSTALCGAVSKAALLLFNEPEDATSGQVQFVLDYVTDVGVVDGVPLGGISHGFSGGMQSLYSWVHGFAGLSKFRSSPLTPPDDPTSVLDTLTKAKTTQLIRPSEKSSDLPKPLAMWKVELMSLCSSVFTCRVKPGADWSKQVDAEWIRFAAFLKSTPVRWDADKDEYTFANGTTLGPPAPPKVVLWQPAEAKPFGLIVRAERSTSWNNIQALYSDPKLVVGVEVTADWWQDGKPQPQIKLTGFSKPMHGYHGQNATSFFSVFQPGDHLKVHLLVNGKEVASTEIDL